MPLFDLIRLISSRFGVVGDWDFRAVREAQRELLDFDDDVRDVYAHGFTYGPGFRVPQDLAEAAEWSRVSAEQGDADTQFVFGYMHDKGMGVPQSHAEAVKWYKQAAKQGQALAQAALGSMFSLGRGVPSDYIEAHIWLSRAISRLPPGEKHNLVTRNRSVLADLMTPEQITEAESIRRDLGPKKP